MKNKTALLVIDMQNDFVEQNALIEVADIRKSIPKFREFINKCREKGIMVIYTKHIFDMVNNPIEARLFPGLAEQGLRENTNGAEIHQKLRPAEEDIIIKKKRYDAFIGTELELILKAKGIENVIITGTMSNVCCESTARTAMMKDFNVFFTSDLTFTSDQMVHNNTLKNIASHFGKVLNSKDIFLFF